jgi:hypothetical protein
MLRKPISPLGLGQGIVQGEQFPVRILQTVFIGRSDGVKSAQTERDDKEIDGETELANGG